MFLMDCLSGFHVFFCIHANANIVLLQISVTTVIIIAVIIIVIAIDIVKKTSKLLDF